MSSSSSDPVTASSSSSQEVVNDNKLYCINDAALDQVRAARAWMKDPKYFKRVTISPSAAIKMMVHGQSGVEKGIKRNGNPLEVMGLLVGHPDTEDPHRIVISDAQALPVEGFETRVIADDESALNFMIELGETNDLTIKDRFCGWYHTHPFDEDTISNCYLSNTDVSTQLQWQRSEDPHGNLWLALVIDPLRSASKGRPEIKAFRVYPPEYSAPLNETPDGTIEPVERLRLEKWGNCWSRYYELEISYFMSTLAQNTLGVLKSNFLWQGSITSTPLQESEDKQRLIRDVHAVAEKLENLDHSRFSHGSSQMYPLLAATTASSSSSSSSLHSQASVGPTIGSGAAASANLIGEKIALAQCQCCATQAVKDSLFAAFQTASARMRSRRQVAATLLQHSESETEISVEPMQL